MSWHSTASFGTSLWIVVFVILGGMAIPMTHGQDEPLQQTDDTREQLVVFANGRMLSGQVTRNGGGYTIEQANGRIQVTAEEVKFVAKDLRDAYRKQRDSIVEPTPATHLALANWCISHRLLDEASEELKKCLKADPEHQEARRLLQRLTDMFRANAPSKPAEPAPLRTPEGFLQPEAESLGGLPKDVATLFTSRIQPLLLNKCGNASCHGVSSANQFRLTPVRTGSSGSRQTTERNLAETLKLIEVDEVYSSRLLRILKGSHGGKGTIFVGQAGAEQMKILREWTWNVAKDQRADRVEFESRKDQVADRRPRKRPHRLAIENDSPPDGDSPAMIQQVSAVVEEPPVEAPKTEEVSKKPRRLKPDPTDAKALALEADDAFDPENFNRRFRR